MEVRRVSLQSGAKYIPSQGTLSLREKRSGTKLRLRRLRLASLSADAFQGSCAGIYLAPDCRDTRLTSTYLWMW